MAHKANPCIKNLLHVSEYENGHNTGPFSLNDNINVNGWFQDTGPFHKKIHSISVHVVLVVPE